MAAEAREPRYYAGVHEDDAVYHASSSGGAFTAITDAVFDAVPGAVVYGCVLDGHLNAVHARATDRAGRDAMRGSKYVQSEVGACYELAAADLAAGRFVVFSGTPCQVAALCSYLAARHVGTERLLTVSFACHGVASRRFYCDYVEHLERRFGAAAVSLNFRAKSRPGKLQDVEVIFSNGRRYLAASTRTDWFYSIYHANLCIRESCFVCPFAGGARPSDIDIADAWGMPEVGGRAASLVVTRTERGEQWVQRAAGAMGLRPVVAGEFSQPQFERPTARPARYDEFWDVYDREGYVAAQRWFGNATPRGRAVAAAVWAADRLGVRELVRRFKQ